MARTTGHDTLKTRRTLEVAGKSYDYFSLAAAAEALGDISKLPYSLKVLLENLLRYEDDRTVTVDDVKAVKGWLNTNSSTAEIAYRPARVLMQDFTGVPAVVDLAAMRDAVVKIGGDGAKINPLSEVDLVIDHSVMVDHFGNADAFKKNVDVEYERNGERYTLLRWGQTAFSNFRVVPPGTGICHQVNVEYLAQSVWTRDDDGKTVAFPDTCVGTDSHTTMVNGLAVLGWGVGGIEAEAAMLGQPISMLIPEVIGFKLTGTLAEGSTATDLVLTITNMLRAKGVVGKFVEFYGPGLASLPLADRATIANMAPEYGATCGFFPIDGETLRYLRTTGRDEDRIALVEAYAKENGFWRGADYAPIYTDTLHLDMGTVVPSLAGPKRPQDRVSLSNVGPTYNAVMQKDFGVDAADLAKAVPVEGADYQLKQGDVVIAAITSCTNTSNPAVMLAAGLVARKARAKGLSVKPWVKTSLAPGSQVVTDYYVKAGLQQDLDALGFNLVGYGCTTCIGNSGPLPEPIANAIDDNNMITAAVLSGNRNFEGRVSPQTRTNYLASPPLVVAYALAGNMKIDFANDAIGTGSDGEAVYLKDIWPTAAEVQDVIARSVTAEMFRSRYADVFKGDPQWQELDVPEDQVYQWDSSSTYVANPPFFTDLQAEPAPVQGISGARCLALLADSITTDHISPAGAIKKASPAGEFLLERQIRPHDFNSYGSRRGNHDIMMRGTFANIRIKNEMLDGVEGGYSLYHPKDGSAAEQAPIYDVAMKYQAEGTPLVIVGGKEYGTGSSRDWAAKGTRLLGVRAVIVESFERIHRSNLVGMGVLPCVFPDGVSRKTLGLTGEETFDLAAPGLGNDQPITPRMTATLTITRKDGSQEKVDLLVRLDTLDEVEYFNNGGILQYVLRNLMAA